MHARLSSGHKMVEQTVPVSADRDFTGRIQLHNLEPGTEQHVAIWFTRDGHAGPEHSVRFVTPPARDHAAPVTFVFGGDVSGQNVCRDATDGLAAFSVMSNSRYDFLIALGDMIYADDVCLEQGYYGNRQVPGTFGPATDIAGYWAHWRYNREDLHHTNALAKAGYYPVWDDHEVVNDAGPQHDTRQQPPYNPDVHLMPIGLRAFLDYNPIGDGESNQLYRSARWGKHLELFLLDTRQFRDANALPDTGRQPKTMLGAKQLAWLIKHVSESDATWKIVVSSVPISIPTGDSWADSGRYGGFEREIHDLLNTFAQVDVRGLLWLTTDVHFAAAFRYRPHPKHPTWTTHELITGPMNARLFPTRAFDDSLGTERLMFHGPPDADTVRNWDEAKHWMNFGRVEIAADGRLRAHVISASGEILYTLDLEA